MKKFIMIHDLKDPNDPEGRSYKSVNLSKKHKIPLYSLVEIKTEEEEPFEWDGVRLYVCLYTRDCDGTPLYSLGFDGCVDRYYMHHGFSEDSLTIIKTPEPIPHPTKSALVVDENEGKSKAR